MARLSWAPILEHAKTIVDSYDTGVTLRQLYYRLVADGTIPNTVVYYRTLSNRSAAARREGWFPDLLDRTSGIEQYQTYSSVADALEAARDTYRLDRTTGQEWTLYLGVEKAGMSEQLFQWFTDPLGIPHVALGGFASQTLASQVRKDIERQGRPAVLIYAGDHDPSGEDIDRDFIDRVGMFDKVIRVALNADQITALNIPRNELDPEVLKKVRRDTRADAFRARHGYLQQYEVDAIPPDALKDLYASALEQFWDDDTYRDVLAAEDEDRSALDYLARRYQ